MSVRVFPKSFTFSTENIPLGVLMGNKSILSSESLIFSTENIPLGVLMCGKLILSSKSML